MPSLRRLGFAALLLTLPACEGGLWVDVPGAPPQAPRGPSDDLPRLDLDGGPPIDSGYCDPGDERGQGVYFGTEEPTMLSMTAGQKMATVQYMTGGGVCSGTVIAPTWVLSAKHCNPSGHTNGEVRFGPDPNSPAFSVGVRSAIVHSGRDLMLLELDAPVTDQAPTLTPIPYYSGDIDSSWVGRMVECAGYGRQENGTIGERRFTAQPISGRSGTYVTVDGEGVRGLCGGDSGGPIYWEDAAGTIYVLGALTGGDSSCVGMDNYTAVDPGWVMQNVGAQTDPCMGETPTGRCDGQTARWCEGQTVREQACAAPEVCGSTSEGFRCAAPPPSGGCGDLTHAGRCAADGAAEWCEEGQPRRADCGACGMVCRADVASGGAVCATP